MSDVAIEIVGISKYFGKVAANKNINLKVNKGEILALLGENGSGKTTLMNILSGIYFPDEGKIFIDGREVRINSPKDAYKYNIGMIHQHFKLVDVFTAGENIVLGNKKGVLVNQKEINDTVMEIASKYGFELNPRKRIHEMSVSEKQTVEIIKVLYRGAEILILDEPTAVLTPQETKKLFAVLKKMREAGKTIIIITHKLNEVMEISDSVSILRKGEYIGTVRTSETDEQSLTDMMVGKSVELKINREISDIDKPILELRDLRIKKDDGSLAIDDVSFYIRSGEILGVAGIAGCGQKELCEAIAGLRRLSGGLIIHKGESLAALTPKEIIAKGISMSFIPEDRLGMGLVSSFSITDNMMLKTYGANKGPFVNRTAARAKAIELIKKLDIVTPSTETPVRLLSGGNVQKVLVGREIESAPNVIITAYPVRGLDINSSYLIYNILNEQKKKGVGILYIGEDLDVMLALCDKIMVICHGKNMGVVHANKTSKEQLGLMMTGALNLLETKKDKHFGMAKDSNLSEEDWAEEKEIASILQQQEEAEAEANNEE